MIVNCATNPASTAAGCDATRAKSANVSVIPMPSMISPRPPTKSGPSNQVKSRGSTSASPQAAATQSGKALASRSSGGVTDEGTGEAGSRVGVASSI